jgi:hypothetical protein
MPLTRIKSRSLANTESFTFGGANVTGNLTVSSVTDLGNVGNVRITGGVADYVLRTDGSGNLSWVAQTGGGSSTDSYARDTANAAFIQANSAYAAANAGGAGTDQFARDTANAAFIQANAAFIQANTGGGGGGGVSNNGSTLSGTITPLANTSEQFNILGITGDITIDAPAGTPSDGQKLIIRIKDAGTSVNISWNVIYRTIVTSLPTSTVPNKTAYIGFIYNTADTDWDAVAISLEN